MFLSCVYITVGGVSLFLITWLLTGFYNSDRRAFAQTPETKEVAPPVPSPPPGVVTNPGVAPSVPPPPGVVTNPGAAPAAVPSPPPGVVTNPGAAPSAVPPPPPGVVTNPGAAPSVPAENLPSMDTPPTNAEAQIQKLSLPADINSPILDSTQEALEDINKKIGEVYRMLRNYQYDPERRRNPFTSPEEFRKKMQKGSTIPSYPTGKYELSKIKLIGIKWSGKLGTAKALFQTPDNVVHTLQKNDRIGMNRGIIYQLREDEVVVLQPKAIASINVAKEEDLFIPIVIRMDRVSSKKL